MKEKLRPDLQLAVPSQLNAFLIRGVNYNSIISNAGKDQRKDFDNSIFRVGDNSRLSAAELPAFGRFSLLIQFYFIL